MVFCKKNIVKNFWSLCLISLCTFMILMPHGFAYASEAEALQAQERSNLKSALQAARQGRWSDAEKKMRSNSPLLARDIFFWYSYRNRKNDISFDEAISFLKRRTDWPDRSGLILAVEKKLVNESRIDDALSWFEENKPRTSEGMDLYLQLLKQEKRHEDAKLVARDWWQNVLLSPEKQSAFYKKYSMYLDEHSHAVRLNRLLFKDYYTSAKQVAAVMGRGYPALVRARVALARGEGNLDSVIRSVPRHLSNDPGLLYERLKWRRKNGHDFGAAEILHNPPDISLVANPEDWWRERHILTRRMIEKKQYDSAYLIVSKHQQTSGFGFAQAEFLSGFLALRFLKKPWVAFEHFEKLYNNVSTPISKARGAYWAGRASDDLGHPDVAAQWYRVAARHQTTYYGQLALATLDDSFKPPRQLPPKKTLDASNRFNRLPMVQAVRIFDNIRMKKEAGLFLNSLAEETQIAEDYLLVADLAEELKYYHSAIRIAKKGLNKNIFLIEHAFPTLLSQMRYIGAEWALVHAIIRQESAFDSDAQSPAGARGLMQLMPATAKETAQQSNLAYRLSWLTERPNYNMRLGSAYITKMLYRFDGSYPLAIAAYNAGPGRVGKWFKTIGNPLEHPEIDLIDWVELIPVYETRNYVQRVLENTYIYRLKLQNVQKSADAPIHVAFRKSK